MSLKKMKLKPPTAHLQININHLVEVPLIKFALGLQILFSIKMSVTLVQPECILTINQGLHLIKTPLVYHCIHY